MHRFVNDVTELQFTARIINIFCIWMQLLKLYQWSTVVWFHLVTQISHELKPPYFLSIMTITLQVFSQMCCHLLYFRYIYDAMCTYCKLPLNKYHHHSFFLAWWKWCTMHWIAGGCKHAVIVTQKDKWRIMGNG